MLDTGGIHIGNDVLLARGVGIYTPNHSVHAAESAAGGCSPRQVRIASRVWIGTGCHLNPGVNIGDVSIIGSGSVVTKDIPPGVIAAGVPCRVGHAITDADKTVFLPRSAPLGTAKSSDGQAAFCRPA